MLAPMVESKLKITGFQEKTLWLNNEYVGYLEHDEIFAIHGDGIARSIGAYDVLAEVPAIFARWYERSSSDNDATAG